MSFIFSPCGQRWYYRGCVLNSVASCCIVSVWSVLYVKSLPEGEFCVCLCRMNILHIIIPERCVTVISLILSYKWPQVSKKYPALIISVSSAHLASFHLSFFSTPVLLHSLIPVVFCGVTAVLLLRKLLLLRAYVINSNHKSLVIGLQSNHWNLKIFSLFCPKKNVSVVVDLVTSSHSRVTLSHVGWIQASQRKNQSAAAVCKYFWYVWICSRCGMTPPLRFLRPPASRGLLSFVFPAGRHVWRHGVSLCPSQTRWETKISSDTSGASLC